MNVCIALLMVSFLILVLLSGLLSVFVDLLHWTNEVSPGEAVSRAQWSRQHAEPPAGVTGRPQQGGLRIQDQSDRNQFQQGA